MMNIIFSLVFLLLLNINNIIVTKGGNESYSIVEVVTPIKIVYDDGIYRKVFSAFTIYDETGNKVVSSGDVFDFAAKVKLPKGIYKITTLNNRGEFVEKSFVVDKENVLQLILCN